MTIDGPHAFAGLVVLSGASVTKSSITTLLEQPLICPVPAGTVFIACGGSIDVSGKGYLGGHAGGNPNEEGRTIGNALGSSVNVGGSHGGLGGVGDTGSAASIYGSILDPRESGGGGGTGLLRGKQWRRSHSASRRVGRSRWRDHRCRAGPGNVGGAWRIDQYDHRPTFGSGRVSADAGYGYTGAGGGGRVAVRYSDLSGLDRARITASGGTGSAKGSAGTVYLKSSSQTYGDLIIDNGGPTTPRTPLPVTGQQLQFDSVTARNSARVISQDEVVASTFSVDSTSYFLTPSRDARAHLTVTTAPDELRFPRGKRRCDGDGCRR